MKREGVGEKEEGGKRKDSEEKGDISQNRDKEWGKLDGKKRGKREGRGRSLNYFLFYTVDHKKRGIYIFANY